MVWWEGRTQDDMKKHGKILSVWTEFVSVIRKQFYPLAYIHQAMMSWKTLPQLKGQSVQGYIQGFRKRDLILGIYKGAYNYVGGAQSVAVGITGVTSEREDTKPSRRYICS